MAVPTWPCCNLTTIVKISCQRGLLRMTNGARNGRPPHADCIVDTQATADVNSARRVIHTDVNSARVISTHKPGHLFNTDLPRKPMPERTYTHTFCCAATVGTPRAHATVGSVSGAKTAKPGAMSQSRK